LLPTRAWELLAGSLLALAAPRLEQALNRKRFTAEAGSAMGLSMILFSMFTLDRSSHVPGLHALVPVIGTTLIIGLGTRDTTVGRLLSSRPMVGIGLISYSTYLWHQPLVVFGKFTRLDSSTSLVQVGLALAALVIACFSWWVIERPFRTKQLLYLRSSLIAATLISAAAFGAFGLLLDAGEGIPNRGDSRALQADVNRFATRESGWCFYNIDANPVQPIGQAGVGCLLGDRHSPSHALLVGDSFAGHFEPFWDTVGKRLGLRVESVTTNWCFPSKGDRYTGPEGSRALEQCRYNRRYVADNLGRYDVIIVAADWRNVFKQNMLADAIQFIDDAAKSGRWVIVMPTPQRFDRESFRKMQRERFFSANVDLGKVSSTEDALAREGNELIGACCNTHPNLVVLTRDQIFQVDGRPSNLTRDNVTYSFDGRHLSVHGSLAAAQDFVDSPAFMHLKDVLSGPASW
jgi:hypothetical protein